MPPSLSMPVCSPIWSIKFWSIARNEMPSTARCTTPDSLRSITTFLTIVSGTANE